MIDLHMHSKYSSDGEIEVTEMLKMAEELGLEYISITDHDTCKAYDELKNIDIKRIYSGTLIPGVEIKTIVAGVNIELLGYYVDMGMMNKELPKIASSFSEINQYESERLVEIFRSKGALIFGKQIEFDFEKESGQKAIAKEVERHPENTEKFKGINYENPSVFYREYISNPNSDFYIDSSFLIPKVGEVIDLIKKAGGLVFIPHVFVYGENSKTVLDELVNKYGVDGIECYYTTFTEEQSKFLVEYCDSHKLYKSSGCDFHGKTKPKNKMGVGYGNMNTPAALIQDWIRR